MKKKIVGIFVCMLFIATAFPAVGTINIDKTIIMEESIVEENNEGLEEKVASTEQDIFPPKSPLGPIFPDRDWNYWKYKNKGDMFSIPKGNVGIGIEIPKEKLDVLGTVQMTGFKMPTGSTSGYVLTSDSYGVGMWQAPASSGVGGSGTTNYIPKFTAATTIGDSVIYEANDNVGIGTTNPANAKLVVDGRIHAGNPYGLIAIGGYSSSIWAKCENPQTGSAIYAINEADTGDAIYAEASGGGRSAIYAQAGSDVDYAIHATALGIGSWAGHFYGDVYVSSKVGIGNTDPKYSLDVVGNRIRLMSQWSAAPKEIMLRTDGTAVDIEANNANLFIKSNTGNTIIQPGTGNVGIGTTDPMAKLHVRHADSPGTPSLILENSYSPGHSKISFRLNNKEYAYIYANDNGATVYNTNGGGIYFRNNGVEDMMILKENELDVMGNIKVVSPSTGATIIELGEGLDYAEGFDVTNNNGIKPGSVLIIDPDNPGKLTISDKPHDRKVVGIVAGANGLSSAVRLGGDNFDYDVALAGRVYCNVDASYGEVSPGDLLTTSPTPGYAMVVKDYCKAQGAILGKAMEPLGYGERGQILVLVTLQ